MKKFVLMLGLLLPAIGSADVTLYPDCDYKGQAISLAPGDYTARELAQFGLPQDVISSIKVPRGLAVTLYEDDRFAGRYGTLRRSDPCLDNDRFDNIVSSLSVRETFDTQASEKPLAAVQKNAQSSSITLFANCNYSGRSAKLVPGDYNLAQLKKLGIDNNMVSSIRVPSGFSITLYENDFLRGRSGRLQRDDNCLTNDGFDDVVSSVSVRRDVSADVSVAPATTVSDSVPVMMYTDCEYGGSAVKLVVGEYTAAQLAAAGIKNNTISSIRVAEGYQIELFENDFYRGRSGTLQQNDSCLVDDRFNDFISSVVVSRNTQTPATTAATQPKAVTFYAHCNYKGGSVRISQGRYDVNAMKANKIGDNVISSLKVEDGYQVTLFDHTKFGGQGKVFTGNDECLDDDALNERVSSMIVEPVKQTRQAELVTEKAAPGSLGNADLAGIDKALTCIEQYVERDICDSHRWRDMSRRCGLTDLELFSDGYLRGHIDAGNCKTEYWSELSRRVANPRLR